MTRPIGQRRLLNATIALGWLLSDEASGVALATQEWTLRGPAPAEAPRAKAGLALSRPEVRLGELLD